jgi:predicted  nucleic acid-binding Zn-ribbon protein
MADEEKIQKQMEFIIEQQAQFAANMQKAEERISKVEGHVTKVEDLLGRLAAATTAGFQELIEKVSAVVDAQIRTEEAISSLAVKMNELAESQEHTDQRLNAMIDIIREGRNGQTQN